MRFFLIAIVVSLLFHSDATSLTQKSEQAEPEISDFAWLAGHWRGKAMGGTFEETWNPPLGDSMIGMFKLVKDGKVVFTELVMLGKFDGDYKMRVKHFDKNFEGWEEKDKFVEFPLISVDKSKATFNGLVIERLTANRLKTTVNVKEGDEVQKITFDARRVVQNSELNGKED